MPDIWQCHRNNHAIPPLNKAGATAPAQLSKTMTQEIIIATISAGFPTIATVITAAIQAKTQSRNAAKQSILQMIMEDHLAVSEGKLPTNYQNILHEFDIYKQAGGNSYVEKKVQEYEQWFEMIERRRGKTVLQ